MTFSTDDNVFGELLHVDLKPGGSEIKVTNENKEEYIQLLTNFRIFNRVSEQFDAFTLGLNEMVPNELLRVFDELELELLIGGISQIDVTDWKSNTDYRGGYSKSHPTIIQFWEVIGEMDNEKRARLLQFVTGTSRVPVNGFKDLQGSDGPRKFTIEKIDGSGLLPKSHTCFNRLDLPMYSSKGLMAGKIHTAVEETMGFTQE